MPSRHAQKPRQNYNKYPVLFKPVINSKMLQNLEGIHKRVVTLPPSIEDAGGDPKAQWSSPCMMMIFDGGDLNCAMHHLVASLHNPFGKNAIATLLIQESVRGPFIELLVKRMEQLDPSVYQHPNFLRTLQKLQKFKPETIVNKKLTVNTSPMLVCDLTHNYLAEDGGPTGVITMHTFRTAKEATQVNLKETIVYDSVSIWNEKLACAYEMCVLIKNNKFMFNCYNMDMGPIQHSFDAGKNDAKIIKGYHYETLTCGQMRKMIVFAIGTIYAN